MANIYFYPDELEPLIEDIINDGRDALFVAFARMTDIERKKILSQSESTFVAAKSYMERSGKNDYVQKLNAYFGGDRYFKLCLSIGHFNLHKRLSGAETALAVEQRQQIRNVRRRRKTQKKKSCRCAARSINSKGKAERGATSAIGFAPHTESYSKRNRSICAI